MHTTAQNSSDYFPSQPPDNHHNSDKRGEEGNIKHMVTI